MSTTTRPSEETSKLPPPVEGTATADISLIDDGHEYESYNPSGWIRKTVIALVILGALGAAAWFGIDYLKPNTAAAKTIPTYTVAAEDIAVEVTESGTLESAKNLDIKCEIAGGTTILWIIEDGAHVQRDQELVRLDDAALREEVTQQEIVVERARSTEIQADKNVEVAKINVREYEEGTYVQELQTLESAVVVAEENLRSAKNTLLHTERMFRKGYATTLELEAQKFAVRRGELDLDTAETAVNVLTNFTKEKMLEDLKSQVATADATLISERKARELEEMKLDRLKLQLSKCVIKAPEAGMVVYANDRGRRGGDETQIAEGAAVREQQTILRLPDLSQMQVKVGIHEAKVDSIRVGMPASIRILNSNVQGTVTSIANQPANNGGWFGSSVKKYDTIITIDNSSARENVELKPGMTAEAKILVADLQDQIAVPNSAVYESHVWVQQPGGKFEMMKVVTGLASESRIAIKDGLDAGDVVARIPSSTFTEEISTLASSRPKMSMEERYGSSRPASGPGGDMSGGPEGRGGGAPGGSAGRGGAAMPSFSDLDADGDGYLTREEAPTQMASFFDTLDGDSDGKVSEDELKTAMSNRQQKPE